MNCACCAAQLSSKMVLRFDAFCVTHSMQLTYVFRSIQSTIKYRLIFVHVFSLIARHPWLAVPMKAQNQTSMPHSVRTLKRHIFHTVGTQQVRQLHTTYGRILLHIVQRYIDLCIEIWNPRREQIRKVCLRCCQVMSCVLALCLPVAFFSVPFSYNLTKSCTAVAAQHATI